MSDAAVRPVTLKLELETRERLKRLAAARQRTSHWLMREAIREYVDREERRDAFRDETLAAWEGYRATALHATEAEVEAWLASWGGDEELPAPACHE